MEQVGNVAKQILSQNKLETSHKEIAIKNNEIALPEYTREHKQDIANKLGACLVVQRTYGKQGSDLQTMVNIFCNVLNDCEPEHVIKALDVWLKKYPEFPTPSDLRSLIKPQPSFSKEVYISIEERRRRGELISDEEVRYQKKYQAHMMKGI